jgi:hypothetical protein
VTNTNGQDDNKHKKNKTGDQSPRPPLWTREKIAGLGPKSIEQLKINAENKGEDEIVLLCLEILEERKPKKQLPARGGGKRRNNKETNPVHIAEEKEAIRKLKNLADDLLKRFDFSERTAQRLSEGTKGFRAHNLLGKNGSPKLGGGKRAGHLYEDRYVSYRLKDQAIGYSIIRFPEQDKLVFEIRGPEDLLAQPIKLWEARPYLKVGTKDGTYEAAQQFETFEMAAAAFSEIVEKFVPKNHAL